MPTCVICLDTLKDPAALPCGHVFCYGCITRVAAAVTPYTAQHFCPTCKHPYMTTQLDPAFIPTYLRQHITPSVRKLQLDYTMPPGPASASPNDIDALRAENASLRTCCYVWRRRAAVHASATLGLVGLARLTRDHALKLKAEKDMMQSRYDELKKRYDITQVYPAYSRHSPFCSHADDEAMDSDSVLCDECRRAASRSPSLARLPSPSPSEKSYYSECSECSLGKRRRARSLERPRKRPTPASRSSSVPPSDSSSATLVKTEVSV
ncbi:hypothetical protein CERSUDRAFT_81989 [Gelatoporia subvermispora B]|uniref:RING-type domain-containing protein n=1 Tax=Ceriporiopsis subvermispora (strain B) TaxID=914234 RepID=M2RK82_CERS8|nr:hypothetical protein CERSUDRAFT_81989 [Gelatoporia subvermispora B]